MKISKRRIIVLSVFVIFILIQTASIAVYQTVGIGENKKRQVITIQEKTEVTLSKEEQETINLINEYRKKNNLEELKIASQLQKVAKLKGEDIVKYEYFSHTSPNLGNPFKLLKDNTIMYKIAGENLAGNTTPEKAVQAWINSSSHRENILEEKFEYTGVCVIECPIYGNVFVQLFIGI